MRRPSAALFWCFSLCLVSVCALVTQNGSLDIRSLSLDTNAQGWARVRRRSLGGPGSYPPRCTWKCGRCTPCLAVRVTVPPGTPATAEYYPEAWRCKCGNRLYTP